MYDIEGQAAHKQGLPSGATRNTTHRDGDVNDGVGRLARKEDTFSHWRCKHLAETSLHCAHCGGGITEIRAGSTGREQERTELNLAIRTKKSAESNRPPPTRSV